MMTTSPKQYGWGYSLGIAITFPVYLLGKLFAWVYIAFRQGFKEVEEFFEN